MPVSKTFWLPEVVADRFWSRVDASGDCWLWMGGTNSRGYGYFWDGTKQLAAHRFVWELLVGTIADGLQIDHLCRIKRCVNPDHLEPVTPRENIYRGVNMVALHAKKIHCANGHLLLGVNLKVTPRQRKCRTCMRSAGRRHNAKRRSHMVAEGLP